MLNNILLLTVSYPFGGGEQFLTRELQYLSYNKTNIAIRPYSSRGNVRAIADNVKVLKVSLLNRCFIYTICIPYSLIKYFKYYFSDLIATIRIEKLNILRFSRFSYIINYILRSSIFITWFDFFYKKNISKNTLIYSYWMNSESYAVSILKRANPYLKTASRVHGGDLYKERNADFLPFRKQIIDSFDRIFTISNHGKEYLIDQYGSKNHSKITLSRLGVIKQERISIKEGSSEVIIASCSSDDPVKRIPEILSTLGYFSTKTPAKVVWLNIGIEKNIFFHKYRKILNLFPNLECRVLGILPHKQIKEEYMKFKPSLFINLSSSEGVPVSIMEAFSFGIPVIATDVGGTSEIVNNSVGSLVDAKVDNKKIKNEIERLIQSREKYSLSAYSRWKDLCNSEYNYNKHYNFLNEVIND